ncbi:hypothetical protein AAF712_014998 [Marasmius tenuissimus]|uniref:Uncharacterized protein n=1 Tax=Marasmius tenuissimus TaxID=585030 RepID=A0ABR2ZAE6_9AGAR
MSSSNIQQQAPSVKAEILRLEKEEEVLEAELKKAIKSWKASRNIERKSERQREVTRLQALLDDTVARKELLRDLAITPSKRALDDGAVSESESALTDLPSSRPGSTIGEPPRVNTSGPPTKKAKSDGSSRSSDRLAGREVAQAKPPSRATKAKGQKSDRTTETTVVTEQEQPESTPNLPSPPSHNAHSNRIKPVVPPSQPPNTVTDESLEASVNPPSASQSNPMVAVPGDSPQQTSTVAPTAKISTGLAIPAPATPSQSEDASMPMTAETRDEDHENDDGESDEDSNSDEPFWVSDPKAYDLERKSVEAVRKYLQAPRSNRLKDSLRTHIRARASYCPEAAISCFELARDVLVTRRGQLKCIYHHLVDKTSQVNDTKGGDQLTGVPYAPVKATKLVTPNGVAAGGAFNRLTLPKNPEGREYCHCGCHVEDAVWGLVLWKTGKIAYDGQEHGYERRRKPPTPADRNFEIMRLKGLGITLAHYWTHEAQVNGQGQVLEYRELTLQERLQRRSSSEQQSMPNLDGLLIMNDESTDR